MVIYATSSNFFSERKWRMRYTRPFIKKLKPFIIMKPEDLKPPHTKEERRIFIYDRVWFLPTSRLPSANEFTFPGWQHADIFGNANPVCVEYCSGNGAWIAAKAKANPQLNWVAVEMKFDRVRKIWSKIKNLGLTNLFVICGEAHQATSLYFPASSVNDVYINFPDPWPKSRHAKNRLIQAEFAKELWRILETGRSLTFVTDDAPYSEWLIEVMSLQPGFVSSYPAPFYSLEETNYGTSYFDELWRSKGRSIRYHHFKKIDQAG